MIYREPDDPIIGVLGRADRRIFSDDPGDYTAEASAAGCASSMRRSRCGRRIRGCTGIAI